MNNLVNITIDGKKLQVQEGKNLVEAAKENGIYIPTLCHFHEVNPPLGTCRICTVIVDNKTTILEHLTQSKTAEGQVKNALIEEYSKYDKDLRLLTYKILLEKFNHQYKDLLPEQKNILKEFIISVNSSARLRNVVNEEMTKLQVEISIITVCPV